MSKFSNNAPIIYSEQEGILVFFLLKLIVKKIQIGDIFNKNPESLFSL